MVYKLKGVCRNGCTLGFYWCQNLDIQSFAGNLANENPLELDEFADLGKKFFPFERISWSGLDIKNCVLLIGFNYLKVLYRHLKIKLISKFLSGLSLKL